jgi:hypothetical protein
LMCSDFVLLHRRKVKGRAEGTILLLKFDYACWLQFLQLALLSESDGERISGQQLGE